MYKSTEELTNILKSKKSYTDFFQEEVGELEFKTIAEYLDMLLSEKKLQKNEVIARDPRYGRVICRCETVTEGEIVAAIHSPVPPTTINGVKRRVGAGMGRCQGGFCGPRVQEILARELGVPLESIMLDQKGSYILTERTKGARK